MSIQVVLSWVRDSWNWAEISSGSCKPGVTG
jgi:hypothetical protein